MKLTKETEKLTDLKTLKGTKVFPNVKDANVPDTIQRKLTAGKNITIDGNVISATDQQPDLSGYQKKLTAGKGIEITSSNVINNTQPAPDLSGYQKKLIAGENITISDDNVITSTGGGGDDSVKLEITNYGEAEGTEESPFLLNPALDFQDEDLFGKIVKIGITSDGVFYSIFSFIYNNTSDGINDVYIVTLEQTNSGFNVDFGGISYIVPGTKNIAISKDGKSCYFVNLFDSALQFVINNFTEYISYTHTLRIKSGTESLDIIVTLDNDTNSEITTLSELCSKLQGQTLDCHGFITQGSYTPLLIEVANDNFTIYYDDDSGSQLSLNYNDASDVTITDRIRQHNVHVEAQ